MRDDVHVGQFDDGGASTPPSGFYTINGDKNDTAPPSTSTIQHARPASNHNGVCVFAFCGGNVRPISEDIDYRVYKQLMTPYGGQTVSGSFRIGRHRQHHHRSVRRQFLIGHLPATHDAIRSDAPHHRVRRR